MEEWSDPELIYFEQPHHPRLPGYDGSKPDLDTVKARAWDQFRWGQQRVKKLRSRLASAASNARQIDHTPALAGGAPLNHEPRKQPHEESAEPTEDGRNYEPKSQQSVGSASPGPSDPNRAPPGRAAAKRPRAPADNDGIDGDEEEEKSRATKRIKLRLRKTTASSSVHTTGSGAPEPGAHMVSPQGSASKRARTPADVDGDGDYQGDGDGQGPSGSKRRRLTKGIHHVSLPVASPEARPATASTAASEPANGSSGSSQAHASSVAGQPAPQPQSSSHYEVPSSQPLNSSRDTINMAKVVKMGKTRPWLFGYRTDEGYGIYAFVKCPGQNCKHHFSTHPLKDDRARDHILSCNQPILDEQDMVRQYASQGMSKFPSANFC